MAVRRLRLLLALRLGRDAGEISFASGLLRLNGLEI